MGTTQFRAYPTVDDGAQPDGKAAVNALAAAVDADVQLLSGGYRLAAIVHYTGGGTFSKGAYAGIKAVEVEVIGGGGGSAAARATSGAQISFGLGGAGGGYAHGFILAAALASSETVSVGAAGTAGSSGTPDAGDGGNSSFGAFVTASGGEGGEAILVSDTADGLALRGSGGAPGGSAYDVGVEGDSYGIVNYTDARLANVAGLNGGSSGGPYGGNRYTTAGASPSALSSANAEAGNGIGGGASGPVNLASSSVRNGAAGTAGRVIVRVYV
jgi:hypothetical protein